VRAAVLGSPVAHSLSPALHRAAYAELDLRWTYESYDVEEEALADFLDGLDEEWVGLSLTMPLKRAALGLVDWASPRARAVAAVNTIVLSRQRRMGANTDVPGMVAALGERGLTSARTAAVLGGGSTARSALAALADVGVSRPSVVVRRPDAVSELRTTAQRLGSRPEVVRWAEAGEALRRDVVVSTVPRGAADALADEIPAEPGVLLDVVYDPWPTPLAAAWRARGGTVVSGLDLLVHQAVLQLALMTGSSVPAERLITVMREAGERALRARAAAAEHA
jgi:shikimate dehydrogenase